MKPSAGGIWLGSALWSVASGLRRAAADRGWVRRTRLPARVISVGNLQAGGAGKTPLVARIAREAAERGLVACILTRGYRGEWERGGGILEPGAGAPDPRLCGDEAALLRDLAPQAWIGVGAERAAQFDRVRARAPRLDLVILDDGFQHASIIKDLEILVVTGRRPHEMLFRDFFRAGRRADLLVWTKGTSLPAGLRDLGLPRARVEFRVDPPLGGAAHLLVTGVADPEDVRAAARGAGWNIVRHLYFPDHAAYSSAGLEAVLSEAREAGLRVLTTGKDAVKWRALGREAGDFVVLEPTVVFAAGPEGAEGERAWNRVLWGT